MSRLAFVRRQKPLQRRRNRISHQRRRKLSTGVQALEKRHLLAADVLFADSFETGSSSNDWNSAWVEDSQNDWFRSTQRSTEGVRSAEVDGWASNATLTLSNPIDMSGYSSAELSFDWLIERGFDSGEYLALDISSNGGASWTSSVRQLDGNSDPEDQWLSETVDLTPFASTDVLIRFRSYASRSNEDANVDNVTITGVPSAPAFPPTVSYPDFSDASGLTLIGDATIANGDTLRLTPAATGMQGAAWYTAEKQFVSANWETTFDFNLNENFGDFGGSDGFTFVIQNHDPTYLRGGGGTLGYEALPNSLVIEFDTFQNIGDDPAQSDGSQSEISIHTAGRGPNFSNEDFSIGRYNTPSIMDDAQTHRVRITHIDGLLSVYYDNLGSPVLEVPVDFHDLLDLDGGRAWLGFTSATGGGYQNHDILNWQYTVLADTSSTIAISDASVLEGDSGTTDLIFTVTRDGDISEPATVDWITGDGTASAGSDYESALGQVSFAANEAVKTIVIPLLGDTVEEFDETLTVTLSNSSVGIIVDKLAEGTILNDDVSEAVGLVSYWAAENNAFDSQGDNDGSLVSGASYAEGQVGTAFRFDGIDDRVLVGDSPSLALTRSMTIEGWIRVDSFTSGDGMILFRGDDRGGLDPYQLRTRFDGTIQFQIKDASNQGASVVTPITPGEFVYVAATLDDATGEMKLFLNGVLQDQTTTSVRPFGTLDADSNPGVGIGNHGGFPATPHNFPFHGLIDELKLHDVALSDAQILANFRATQGDLQPSVTISNGIVTEGEERLRFSDTFVQPGRGGLSSPRGLAFGPDGNLYVASDGTDSILRYNAATGAFIDTFVPSGTQGLDRPWDIAFHEGDLYVVSNLSNSVLRFDGQSGSFISEFVAPGEGGLEGPRGLFFGNNNDLYVTSTGNDDAVLRFNATTGVFVDEFIGSRAGGLDNPTAVVAGPDGNFYVTNTNSAGNSVLRYDTNGNFVDTFIESGSGGLDGPTDLLFVEGDGLLYVCSARGDAILTYDISTGDFVGEINTTGSGLDNANAFVFDQVGRLYVSSRLTDEILRYSADTSMVLEATLSNVWPDPISVQFATSDGTAMAGEDYVATSGNLQFSSGETTQPVFVSIIDDTVAEDPETFTINLSNPNGATIVDGQATGTIGDDGDPASLPPVADDDAYTVDEDSMLNVASPGVLDGDTDPEGDSLTAALVSNASHGLVSLNADGSFTYTPNADYAGPDSFTYRANDGTSDSNLATVNLTVTPVNDAPTADDQAVEVLEDTSKSITLSASDIEGDSLTYIIQSGPASGTLTGTGPDRIYTPNPGFVGEDSFTFLVNDGTDDSPTGIVSIVVDPVASGPNLSFGDLSSVGSSWQTITLSKTYTSMIVVATPRYNAGSGPGVVRIDNVTANSFDVRVDNVGTTPFSGGVHYVAVEEGVYDEPGFKLEAVKYSEAETSRKNGWLIDSASYQQTYTNPVVVGQVMSANDPDWSVFWASSSSRTSPPTSSQLNVGKHIAEDPDTARVPETVGYIVIEATQSGTIEGLPFVAGVGSDSVRGVGNGTYQYSYTAMPNAKAAILSSAGMDGGDGGWAVLRGSNPLPPADGTIALAIDEDQLGDSERSHTTEQVAYFVIDPPLTPAVPQASDHWADPMDVDGDSSVTALDALRIINHLSRTDDFNRTVGGQEVFDTNQDGILSALDALVVINRLSRQPSRSSIAPVASIDAVDAVFGAANDVEDDYDEMMNDWVTPKL